MNYTLITGASEGLGKALAIECAGRGMNLILVALPGPQLKALTALIRKNYSVDVRMLEIDLARDGACEEVFAAVTRWRIQVTMLINNAGIGNSYRFEQGSIGFYERQIRVNVLVPTLLARLFLAQINPDTKSYLLNVGSMSCFFYLLNKQVYGASKAYLYYFSKSLQKEFSRRTLNVMVLCPGSMNTNIALTLVNKTGTVMSRLAIMNPEEVAPVAIDHLLRGRSVLIPGFVNKLYMALDLLLPEFLKTRITNYNMKRMGTDGTLRRYIPDTHLGKSRPAA